MTRKTYTGPLIDVSFDGAVCQHAAECVRGLPEVFDTAARPWIDPSGISTEAQRDRLIEVIGRCPSGALRYETKAEPDAPELPASAAAEAAPAGPRAHAGD
ncbi:MAG: (4Fe-4S)-binding protein [Jatrophihabitans sp.]